MTKLKLPKEVIEKLEEINKLYDVKTPLEKTVRLPFYYYLNWSSYQDFLNKYNITTEIIKMAFENGWEEEREFQVGDIVLHENKLWILSKDTDGIDCPNVDDGQQMYVSFANRNKDDVKLVCKASFNCIKY